MSRKKFSHLLEKYQRGECTLREKRFVEYWFGLVEPQPEETQEQVDWEHLEEKMWSQMQTKMNGGVEERELHISFFRTSAFKWLSAACLVLFTSIAFYYGSEGFLNSGRYTASDWIIRVNNSQDVKTIALADGSVVELWPNSTLRFRKSFGDKQRDVNLTGKAFFSIKRDTSKPFYVHSGKIVTRVLGTSFYVQEGTAAQLPKVEVVTGTVAVYEAPSAGRRQVDNIILKANQQATFHTDKHTFTTGLVDAPKLIDPDMDPAKLRFYNTPLTQVVQILKSAYGVDISIANAGMKNCTLTADLSGQPMYTQLNIICAALTVKYKIASTSILLTGKGCASRS